MPNPNSPVQPTGFERDILMRATLDADTNQVFENQDIERLWLFIYLVPVFGLAPAVWTLASRTSDRRQRNTSRLAVTVAVVWVLGYAGLNIGSIGSGTEMSALGSSVLLLNTFLTSGYFLTCLWLMARLWQNQPLHLPGLSKISKHLP
jgi:hypothetical protein